MVAVLLVLCMFMDELRARIAGIPFLEGRDAAMGLACLTGATLIANPLVASHLLAATYGMGGGMAMVAVGGLPLGLAYAGAMKCGLQLNRIRWRKPWQILRDAGWLRTNLADDEDAGQAQSSPAALLDPDFPLRPRTDGLCLGFSQDTGEPVFVNDDLLTRHLYIMGKSGVGKTVLMFYMAFQQIARGGGMLFVDGKMDDVNLLTIWHYLCWAGRQQDLLVVNPGNPKVSNTYNPILYGTPDEKAARVIGMIPDTSNNPGSDFYRNEATQGLTTIFAALDIAALSYHAMDLAALLNNDEMLLDLERQVEAKAANSDELKNLKLFLDKFRIPEWDTKSGNAGGLDVTKMKATLGGVVSRLFQFGVGSFAEVMRAHHPEVQLYDAILQGKIVYVALPTMGKAEVAASFGKLIVGDLRTAISWVQELAKERRPKIPFMVLLDEAGSYATQQLTRIVEQSRSASIFVVPAVQTSANFRAISEEVDSMITGNTHTKIYFQLGDDASAQAAAEFLGQEKRATRTLSTSQSDSTSAQSLRVSPIGAEGQGSGVTYGEREQDEARVSAEQLKGLEMGQSITAIGFRHVHNTRVPFLTITPEMQAAYGRPQIWRERDTKLHRTPSGMTVLLQPADYYSGSLTFLAKREERQAKKAAERAAAQSGNGKEKKGGSNKLDPQDMALLERVTAQGVI